MNGKRPYMDYQQYRAARRLVHECCNYDNGNCILLDNGEPCVVSANDKMKENAEEKM